MRNSFCRCIRTVAMPVTVLVLSCGCNHEDATAPLNGAPDVPSSPQPANNAVGRSPSVMLGWSCTDPDGGALTYDVYCDPHYPPDSIVSSNQSGTTFGMSGLSGGTRYYWKVVAMDNHANVTRGPVWAFTTGAVGGSPCPGAPTVEYAGRTYNTIQIAGQCWLRENLDLGRMVSGTADQTDNDTIEKYCYDNNPANCAAYGALYQWNEAMQYGTTPGPVGICPPGWHVPTLTEFTTLKTGMSGDGNALKAIGQGTGGGVGTNASGFSALLAGHRYDDGDFYSLGDFASFWSSTAYDTTYVHLLILDFGYPYVYQNAAGRRSGFSVRCLKD